MISSQVAERPSLDLLEISSHLRKQGYPEKALYVVELCGSPSNNFIMATCGCGTRAIELNHSCNKPFCPNCSKKRVKRIRNRLLPFLKYYKNNSMFQYRFLTISPENYKNLNEGLIDVQKSFNKFVRRKYIKERIKGGFWVIEVTKLKDTWNIHVHAIIYSRYLDNTHRGHCQHCGQNYLKYDRFSKKFFCANRGCGKLYKGIIRNSKVQTEFELSSGRSCMVDISRVTSPFSVLNYCLKYISSSKVSFSKMSDYAYYLTQTYHKKQINAFGKFYNFKKQIKNLPFYYKNPPRCPKCWEVIRFSFDYEVNKILKDPPDPPPEKGFFVYEKLQ